MERRIKNEGKNRGSMTVEVSLLMPICLGIFYLYIIFFLFLICRGNDMNQVSQQLYKGEGEMTEASLQVENQGRQVVVSKEGEVAGLYGVVKMCRGGEEPVKQIRRWQLARDTISQGE